MLLKFEESRKKIVFAILVNILIILNYAVLVVLSVITFNFFLMIISIFFGLVVFINTKPLLRAYRAPQSIEISENGIYVKPLEKRIAFDEIEKVYKDKYEIATARMSLKYYYPVIYTKDKTIIRLKYEGKSQVYYDKLFYLLEDLTNAKDENEIRDIFSKVQTGFTFGYVDFTRILHLLILSIFTYFLLAVIFTSKINWFHFKKKAIIINS